MLSFKKHKSSSSESSNDNQKKLRIKHSSSESSNDNQQNIRIKCLCCGYKIKRNQTILALMPRGQITELKYIKNNNFVTDNDIKFIWCKKQWNLSKIGCYGCITHEKCLEELKNKLNINVTFEDIYKHINDENQLDKIKYLDSLEETWTNFILYKNASLQRKKSFDRFQRLRCSKSYSIERNIYKKKLTI